MHKLLHIAHLAPPPAIALLAMVFGPAPAASSADMIASHARDRTEQTPTSPDDPIERGDSHDADRAGAFVAPKASKPGPFKDSAHPTAPTEVRSSVPRQSSGALDKVCLGPPPARPHRRTPHQPQAPPAR